jgi:hypothetical protein
MTEKRTALVTRASAGLATLLAKELNLATT